MTYQPIDDQTGDDPREFLMEHFRWMLGSGVCDPQEYLLKCFVEALINCGLSRADIVPFNHAPAGNITWHGVVMGRNQWFGLGEGQGATSTRLRVGIHTGGRNGSLYVFRQRFTEELIAARNGKEEHGGINYPLRISRLMRAVVEGPEQICHRLVHELYALGLARDELMRELAVIRSFAATAALNDLGDHLGLLSSRAYGYQRRWPTRRRLAVTVQSNSHLFLEVEGYTVAPMVHRAPSLGLLASSQEFPF
jgi:hypothetical protein